MADRLPCSWLYSLAMAGIVLALLTGLAALLPAVAQARESARWQRCEQRLKSEVPRATDSFWRNSR